MISEKWMKWTFLEASARTIAKVFEKIAGLISSTIPHLFLITLILGLVQTITGFIVSKIQRNKLLTDKESILGSCLFGFFAVICTITVFAVFLFGGDIGVNTFIITLSIVPGALIDRLFFSHKLNKRQWLGILVAISAGYSILGWPLLSDFLQLPLWVWLSLSLPLLLSINQGITKKVKKVDPFVKNFWGGLTTLILCFVSLIFLNSLNLLVDFSPSMQKIWITSIIVGVIVIGIWNFNLLSYKNGATIALQRMLMNCFFLIMSMILGVVIFQESFTFAKFSGLLLYPIAFILIDTNTWNYFSLRFSKIKE